MDEYPPTLLQDFGKIALKAPPPGRIHFYGTRNVKRSMQSLVLNDLMLQRKETHDDHNRNILIDRIHTQARKEL